MQNRYAADVGDFGKLALLNALAKNDIRLGVNWYLNAEEEVNNDGLFVDYQNLRDCDPGMHDGLVRIARSSSRGVRALEEANILPLSTVFFSEPLPAKAAASDYRRRRQLWSDAAYRALAEAEIVFMDPDNGLSDKPISARNGGKYIEATELSRYIARGQSLVVYQHQTREPGGLATAIPQAFVRFRSLGCERTWAVVFRRKSVRVYFVLASKPYADILQSRTVEFLETRWGRQKHFEVIESEGPTMESSSTSMPSLVLDSQREDLERPYSVATSAHRTLSQPDGAGIRRGVRLFRYLADRANEGDAVGISYGGFIAYIHGAADFQRIASRNYLPSDSDVAVQVALRVTNEAGGRIMVSRNTGSIQAGMDTFVWNSAKPFDRPPRAWASRRYRIPYSRDQWLACFPNGVRRIVSATELDQLTQTK